MKIRDQGFRSPNRIHLRVTTQFDDDTFTEIKAFAEKRGLSFSRAVWALVVTGLQTKADF